MENQGRHIATATVLTIISTVVVYYLLVVMFPRVTNASAEGLSVEAMWTAHYWVIAFLFSLIIVFMLYSVVVFRRREGDEGDGWYTHGNTALEIGWTVAPIGIVLVFAFWGSSLLLEMTTDEKDAEAWVVEVTGYKWAWRFHYPETGHTVGHFVVPVDRPVLLKLESEDVLHSFWVPEFHVKQDLLPGPNNERLLRFTPTMTTDQIVADKLATQGIENYQVRVRCAEICGTSHAYMYADVYSEASMSAVEERLEALSALPSDPVERGQFWYENFGCSTCHSLDGSVDGYAGPSWLGLTARVDTEYITTSIYQPNAEIVEGYAAGVMPQGFEAQFADATASYAARGITDVDVVSELISFMATLNE